MPLNKIPNLSPTEAAYVAGILDGEGSMSYTSLTKERAKRLAATLVITILYRTGLQKRGALPLMK